MPDISGRLRARPGWQRYVFSILLVGVVVVARLGLDPWWGQEQNRHLVFLPTVMLAAYLAGFGPGLVAALLSTIALDLLWSPPTHTLNVTFELVLFFALGV